VLSLKHIKSLIIKVKIRISRGESLSQVFRDYYGVSIGNNVRFTGIPKWGSEPYLIEIGDNVTITQDVSFNTHDGGVGLFRNEYPGINVFGRIKIGNNVFIGSHCIILPDIEIGNNVIIGAGSVITKNIPSNCVAVGAPAVAIKNIEDYRKSALEKAMYVRETDPIKRKNEILSKIKQL
jgi:acetyltransferase-like isoleucine patch superfamily enzyme